MTLWDYDSPPNWRKRIGKKNPVATERGWVDPDTGEVLVASKNLSTKAGAADILEVIFAEEAYEQGDPLSVTVVFNEKVDVTAGATIEVSWSGVGGNFSLHAVEQLDESRIVFDKKADLITPEVVPSEGGELSIGAQTLSGTVVDTGTAVATNLAVSADIGTAAGTRLVGPAASIDGVSFGEVAYSQTDPLTLEVEFDEAVDVTAGASVVVSWSGVSGNVTLYAAEQLAATTVVFDLESDLVTPATVPAETGDLSVAEQDLGGTINDAGTTVVSDPHIGATEASGAGVISVA